MTDAAQQAHVLRMLQNLDEGQLHIIKRIAELDGKIEAGREDRDEIKTMLRKLDDPDVGRVARVELTVKALQDAMGVINSLRDRGIGFVIGVACVLILIGAGLGAGVRKIAQLFFGG